MFSVLFVAFFLLLNPCLALRPRPIHSLDHNETRQIFSNQKNSFISSSSNNSTLLEVTAGNAPNTAEFIDAVHTLCSSSEHPTTAFEYFICLQTHVSLITLPPLLKKYQKKLLHEVGSNRNPKTVVVEGFGPIGGNLALNARLNGDIVFVVERHEIFKENQAFTLYTPSIEILIKLGFDYSGYGFCKSSLQYLYLFLFGLFPTKVNFFPLEVVGWNELTNEVLCLHWNSASTRDNQRAALKKAGWYHVDYTVWKTLITNPFWWDGSPIVDLAEIYAIPTDLVIAAGGPNSAFHHIIPGVQTGFNAGGDKSNKLVTTAAIIVKIPILDDGTPMAAGTFDAIQEKVISWKIKSRGLSHQAKFVPKKAYDSKASNELWIERLFSLAELTELWKTKGIPELFTGKEATKLVDFVGRVVHSDLQGEIDYTNNANPKLALLQKLLVDLDEIALFVGAKPSTPLLLSKVEIAGFLVSNRIVPSDNLVSKLPSAGTPQVKVIFLGDAFHESLFLKGNGVLIHMMEIIGEKSQFPGLPTMDQILPDVDSKELLAWIEGVYTFGLKYVMGMNAVLE